jgi:putative N6-adenine-specific DNA methylase
MAPKIMGISKRTKSDHQSWKQHYKEQCEKKGWKAEAFWENKVLVHVLCPVHSEADCLEEMENRLKEHHEEYQVVATSLGRIDMMLTWKGIVLLNYTLRLGLRLLVKMFSGMMRTEEDLYQMGLVIPWEEIFSLHQTFAVYSQVKNRRVHNALIESLKLKDGIADRFREVFGARPHVNKESPDIRIMIKDHEGFVEISLDTSGESLSHRGYRPSLKQKTTAPLRETLACQLLHCAGFQKICDAFWGSTSDPATVKAVMIQRGADQLYKMVTPTQYQEILTNVNPYVKGPQKQLLLYPHLMDPMCGTGTLIMEAALMMFQRYPQLRRSVFPYEHFLFHQHEDRSLVSMKKHLSIQLLQTQKNLQDYQQHLQFFIQSFGLNKPSSPLPFVASDTNGEMLSLLREQLHLTSLDDVCLIEKRDFFQQEKRSDGGLLLMNVPYGKRLEKDLDEHFYKNIGDHWKKHFQHYVCWILSNDRDALKTLGLRKTVQKSLKNGGEDCFFYQYIMS